MGLTRRPGRAPRFYAVIALATLPGAGMDFTKLDPIKALFWSAVINGVVAVPVMFLMMLLSGREDVMHGFRVRGGLRVVGWMATGVMAAAAIGMFATIVN